MFSTVSPLMILTAAFIVAIFIYNLYLVVFAAKRAKFKATQYAVSRKINQFTQ